MRTFFRKALPLLAAACCGLAATAQPEAGTLDYYLAAARAGSPLLADLRGQKEVAASELERLRSAFTRSRLEAAGEILFVPVVSCDGGGTSLKLWAQDGTDYFGYDLGESSGHLHAGLSWTKPLLGGTAYRAAREQTLAGQARTDGQMRLETHQLERAVTEQYVVCLHDLAEAAQADSAETLLLRQRGAVERLAAHGLALPTDLHLLDVEREGICATRLAAAQAYRSHLAGLRALCGLTDTFSVRLCPAALTPRPVAQGRGEFAEQYRLDSLVAQAGQRAWEVQYRPQLSLFADGGLRTGGWERSWQHLGWSAGLTFRWTLFDGRQRRERRRQLATRLSTLAAYSSHEAAQRSVRLGQVSDELRSNEAQRQTLLKQLAAYDAVLDDYGKLIACGRLSVIDYLSVLRRRLDAAARLDVLSTNRQLALAAWNYWAW